MKAAVSLTLLASLLAAAPALGGGFQGGVTAGYTGGPGLQVSGMFHEFTRDLPLSARLTLGYNGASAGDPYAARRVFINDNTNGDPEKSAATWQFRFDLLFPALKLGPQQLYLFVGPRHARYTADFNYIGGNEHFEVTSNPWGAGAGFESWFAVGDRTDFVLQLGFDWYGEAKLAGHDTAYLPGGDHVNPRDGYDYAAADDAVDQPRYEILGMMGLKVAF